MIKVFEVKIQKRQVFLNGIFRFDFSSSHAKRNT